MQLLKSNKSGWSRDYDADSCFPAGTEVYRKGLLACAVSKENGLWHLSISHPYCDPSYYEIKEARYSLLPDSCYMAQILPPSKDFVNIHKHCFHLYEIPEKYAA